MKTLKFILMSLIVLIMAGSCDKEKDDPVYAALSIYGHILHLAILDSSGNDLTKGIETERVKTNFDTGEKYYVPGSEEDGVVIIKRGLNTLDILFEEGVSNPSNPEPTPSINGRPAYILDETEPPVTWLCKGWFFKDSGLKYEIINPDYNYIWLAATSRKPDVSKGNKFAEKITFRFTCPYIFGDNQVHDFVTWWKLTQYVSEEYGVRDYPVCYRVEFEGKEFPLAYASRVVHDDTQPFVTITLNR